jgi:solute carrier family 25 phosphate transporter 23/24/25/41
MAGSLAGVVTKTLTAPLERVKTILQVEGMTAIKAAQKAAAESGGPVTRPPRTSILNTFRSIYRLDGVRGFWFGNAANCLRVIPVYALKFGFNDNITEALRASPGAQLTYLQLVASGTLAGLLQMVITYPLETVRTRLTVGAAHGAQYNGILHCATETVKHEGVRGLYKGLSPTILSGPPYVGLQMSSFEILSRKARELDLFGGSAVANNATCGMISGLFAQTVTYPGDTIRKRMQTDGIRGATPM